MENAERREARLEKEKAAEKATGRTEAKDGIHGKLEKAKAEIKAKGTDTIPKNRAKDLASVLKREKTMILRGLCEQSLIL